jgi:outer membrane protein assembly factor BamB
MNKAVRTAIPIAVAVAGCCAVILWFLTSGREGLIERRPGADRSGAAAESDDSGVWQGKLIQSNGVPADLTGSWPQFRGPNRDGICTDTATLSRSWPAEGPKALWKLNLGEGYAGAAIWKGRVFVLDYDMTNRADALRCLSFADGKEIWRYTYPVKVKRNHGMSRTVPTITEKYLISLGPKCNVLCLDPLTGEFKWQIHLVKDFGAEVPQWYAGQCPLIEGDRLILGVGGSDALLAAVECATGKVIWKTPNPNHWLMTHSSVVPMEFKDRRMYVYCASGGVVAVSASDGTVLWEYPDWRISIANIPSPIVLGDGRIFFTGGYDAGSLMLHVTETGGKLTVAPVFRLTAKVFGAAQQTPLLYRDHLFGVRADGQLVCLDLNGKVTWESGPSHKFGYGPFMIAQDMLFVLDDSGLLTLAEASVDGFKQLAQAKVLQGPDAWGPMALANGRLILRDMNQMICLEVGR